jgi:hypothetical protein
VESAGVSARRDEQAPAARFFVELPRRSGDPLVAGARGTVRFDLSRSGRRELWRVRLDRGAVTVEHAPPLAPADTTVQCRGEMLDRMLTGEVNPLTAVLRGAIDVTGDVDLLLRLVRLFPPSEASAEHGGR